MTDSFRTSIYFSFIQIGSYRYCCQGIFCPDCDLRISITIFTKEYVINSSLPMNCRENSFNISLEADAPPGDYRIRVSIFSIIPQTEEQVLLLINRWNVSE